ncbi:MAG: anaerobic glycerol-3-phosphate dehydrogenase subunit B [Chloroflexi bacterium]|nr:MAG: anaerobic glycerol-3-phosphate dehydrogenase subunit B [Chloroflexota bacterium]
MRRSSMVDLIVMGAGLSGMMAAYTAARAGLSVRVAAKGLGSMHWSAGTIDVLGYLPEMYEDAVKRPLEAIQSLTETHPTHPYALMGAEQVSQALATFVALSKEIGMPYGGAANPGDNLLLPSPAGAARPTYLAPQAQLAGDLSRAEPMVIVGFKGMRDFFPELIAENLNKLGYAARATFLDLSLITDQRDRNTVQLARGLDMKEKRIALAAALKKVVQPGERIGLPAILGMTHHLMLLAELEEATSSPVFEIPTLPPSVPGVRLFTALREHARGMGVRVEAGVEVIHSQTIAANGSPGKVTWVESATGARPWRQHAPKFLLATGGILGGGFDSNIDGRVWETIFDLPLTVPQNRANWFEAGFFSQSGHPVFNGGVAVNKDYQPIDSEGKPVYKNLWAAGNILAQYDPIQERSLEGTAVSTGIAAALALSQ